MLKKLPFDQKKILIAKIQDYFEDEVGKTLGDIATENIINFMLQTLGPLVYNEALQDARSVVNERILSLEDELYTLEKPLKL
ncbi:DUF2164 domain-containing protein [Paenibacillus psychroresistens]|uniref:DUF2164 domain-containing protein n=1 Tax=Paenibacillus psychroresistens TaxID=1778678 RepID=A0A6B8RQN6_9BACL|nr:DUF2164 domain-containing protein [Paenibacillus psychroresistens]QGQ98114.1 DUF2164 domain-containing protein [Paenibacillus psychroresistens]